MPIPVYIHVTAMPMPAGGEAAVHGCAAVPKVSDHVALLTHQLPALVPHPDALFRRRHEV